MLSRTENDQYAGTLTYVLLNEKKYFWLLYFVIKEEIMFGDFDQLLEVTMVEKEFIT